MQVLQNVLSNRYVLIFLGGAVGSVLRYSLGAWVQHLGGSGFPRSTLFINVLGSFLIGLLLRFSAEGALFVGHGSVWGFYHFLYPELGNPNLDAKQPVVPGTALWAGQPVAGAAGGFYGVLAGRTDGGVKEENMKLEGEAKLLRIFIGEADKWHGRPLHEALMDQARAWGLAGASVFKGFEGYGAHSRIHSAKILQLSEDLPVLVEIVDTEEKIRAFLPVLDAMVQEGLVTMEKVEVIRYLPREGKP
jgi:PII-like signaling protein